ncbi:mandelate racemase/muconate lactonizing enzyme family protein [Agrococcus sp. BE272]|uniref:mandelate racemase/muconate lactonizing enzyme family protein n=1 Tax=Agrococcus sp. BE272 TaxID=2817727 RepID=UPI00285BE12D|nr:mandelate racemase/muconate lactonizing enzyme family protein [Agrococcus sp. BE272]MDR7233632.1 L-alanine-DL-glutamate epimerase-like enolase superfamily enzyme [Agrococcus sp. BE272]
MRLDRVRITVLSAPVTELIPMSFSQLGSREMVLVEVMADGLTGLGESWVNYPSWAAKERVATIQDGVVPLLVDLDISDPRAVHRHLERRLGALARQWGAPGPIWQAISAIDIALWDLAAQASGRSVAGMLTDGAPRATVSAYASGIGPSQVEQYCEAAMRAGFTAVKARVGFGRERDERTLRDARSAIGAETDLYVDANQAWTIAEARDFSERSADLRLGWIEEPLAGNALDDLRTLAALVETPLACGENLYGAAEFARYAGSGALQLIQPDLAKNGGVTLAAEVAAALPAGMQLAPHCYGGAIVTAASVQFAAASDAVPYLELDVRPNPLRDDILIDPLVVVDGAIPVPSGAGLGVSLDQDAIRHYSVERRECDLRAVV